MTTNDTLILENQLRDIVLMGMYSITATISVVGNFIICKIVFWSKFKMKKSTRVLVGNLAISDILGGLTIPLQWLFCSSYILQFYSFEFMCAVVKSLQVLSFYMSSLVMMLIAMERHRAVTKPFALPFRSTLYVSITWFVTTVFVATSMGSAKIFEYFGEDCVICCRIVLKFSHPFNSDIMRNQRVWGIWIGQYVFPLLVTALLYAIIIRRVCFVPPVTSLQRETRDSQNKKLIIMLVTVVIVFALCWLPLHALNFTDYVVRKIETKVNQEKGTNVCNESTLYFVLYWFGVSSCSYNPFIYWWLNEEFRAHIKQFFRCCRREQRSGEEEASEEIGRRQARRSQSVTTTTTVTTATTTSQTSSSDERYTVAVL